jgi:hypothetical protein
MYRHRLRARENERPDLSVKVRQTVELNPGSSRNRSMTAVPEL